jgi:outer membrane protein OmpA-like peptidoglycan-associated protein
MRGRRLSDLARQAGVDACELDRHQFVCAYAARLSIEAPMRVAILLLFAVLSGCSGKDGKSFYVFFQPYDGSLDAQAQATVQQAASYANAHPLMPISIAGDATRPGDGIDTLRQQRVAVVKDALIKDGVGAFGIDVEGAGLAYANGVPDQPVGRVTINVGL